jgi:hypothetical protein
LREYVKNALRTYMYFLQGKDKDFSNILSVIVTARRPRTFLAKAVERGIVFHEEPGKPWLRWGQVGFQDVVIVVCKDLPLEERYYPWLVFTPSNTDKWEAFVSKVKAEGNQNFWKLLRN